MFSLSLGSQGHAGRADCGVVLDPVGGSQVTFEDPRFLQTLCLSSPQAHVSNTAE